jgi:hypothetical protein
MGRLNEAQRTKVGNDHVGHWTQANLLGPPIEIEPGFGLPQLVALIDAYHQKGEEITQMAGTDLPLLRAARDAAFGSSKADENGVWYWLLRYKPMVQARLGRGHPLSKTVPNIGDVTPGRYVTILQRFIDHWERVNAALASPLTLGSFLLAKLTAAHDLIVAKGKAIAALEEGALPLARAQREALFGDVPEQERLPTSIIAGLELYHVTIDTSFANQPLAQSLPGLFPSGVPSALPTFRFNWVALSDAQVKVWIESPNFPSAVNYVLTEGAYEEAVPYVASPPGGTQVSTWSNVQIVDEIDVLALRDVDARTLAIGARDVNFAEPV